MNRVNFEDTEKIRLELGCGDKNHWREGYVHLDINDNGQEIVWDFTKGLPFRDSSCIEIYASHTFEHIERPDLITVFNECWRVLQKDGQLWVVVPAWNSDSGFILPHYTQFSESTFRHMTCEMNPDYRDLTAVHSLSIKKWRTLELVTNERPDIHWKGVPEGK